MFFLLAARPYMLPNPVNRQSYVRLCYDVINAGHDLLGSIQDEAKTSPAPQFEPRGNETLERGCRIAEGLISKGSGVETMQMIFHLWLEMLCYTAYRTGATHTVMPNT
jgi:hypothetical protein